MSICVHKPPNFCSPISLKSLNQHSLQPNLFKLSSSANSLTVTQLTFRLYRVSRLRCQLRSRNSKESKSSFQTWAKLVTDPEVCRSLTKFAGFLEPWLGRLCAAPVESGLSVGVAHQQEAADQRRRRDGAEAHPPLRGSRGSTVVDLLANPYQPSRFLPFLPKRSPPEETKSASEHGHGAEGQKPANCASRVGRLATYSDDATSTRADPIADCRIDEFARASVGDPMIPPNESAPCGASLISGDRTLPA
ncbi:hypothetical protein FQR65_LT20580 [Abscondita terminalis]|nr:hypothetical protein FQR65_LT20580 [Abscondita terminalis]